MKSTWSNILFLAAGANAAASTQRVVQASIQHFESKELGPAVPLIKLGLGNPAQDITGIFDTASSDIIVPEAAPFKPDAAADVQLLAGKSFNATLSRGEHFEGDYAKTTVTLGGVEVSDAQVGFASNIQTQAKTSEFAVVGVGLVAREATANKYNNFPRILNESGVTNSQAYSVVLNATPFGNGSVFFGGIDRSKFQGELQQVPLVKDKAGQFSEFLVELSSIALIPAAAPGTVRRSTLQERRERMRRMSLGGIDVPRRASSHPATFNRKRQDFGSGGGEEPLGFGSDEQSFGPSPDGQSFSPSPDGQSFGPSPDGLSFGPSPDGQSFDPSPNGQLFSPSPDGQSFGPSPDGQSFGPGPGEASPPPNEIQSPFEDIFQGPTNGIDTGDIENNIQDPSNDGNQALPGGIDNSFRNRPDDGNQGPSGGIDNNFQNGPDDGNQGPPGGRPDDRLQNRPDGGNQGSLDGEQRLPGEQQGDSNGGIDSNSPSSENQNLGSFPNGDTRGGDENSIKNPADNVVENPIDSKAPFDSNNPTNSKKPGNNQGVTDGNNQGVTDGNNPGKTDGNSQGVTDGNNPGKTDGNSQGVTDGNNPGKTNGNNQGITDGNSQGVTDGNSQGVTDGNNPGKTDGNNPGITDGNNKGITDGNSPSEDPASNSPVNNDADKNKDIPKKEAPKKEAPKKEAPKKEAPKQEAPKQGAPKQGAPKQEAPKQGAPKQGAPKEAPKKETPKKDNGGSQPAKPITSINLSLDKRSAVTLMSTAGGAMALPAAVVSGMARALGTSFSATDGLGSVECGRLGGGASLLLRFRNDTVEARVPLANLRVSAELADPAIAQRGLCEVAVRAVPDGGAEPNVATLPFFASMYTVFDLGNRSLWFAQARGDPAVSDGAQLEEFP